MIGSPTKDLHLIYNAPMLGAQALLRTSHKVRRPENADVGLMNQKCNACYEIFTWHPNEDAQ